MRNPMTLAAIALTAAAASAETVTQTIDFDWNMDTGLEIGSFAGFDSAGGTRQLTGVSIGIDASAQWDVSVLNYSSTAYEPGEWWANGLANFNVLLGEFGPDSVERIAGAVEFHGLTDSLGAGSGDPISGEPGDPVTIGSFSAFIGNYFEMDASEFGVFQNGVIQARLLGFTDGVIDGPNGGVDGLVVNTDLLSAEGTVTLTYTYAVVPAPAGLALLGVFSPLAARRRR